MGNHLSNTVKRSAKNWNFENRARKEVERHKDKPKVAPQHETTKEVIEQFQREHPELLQAQKEKNESLHDRLAGMVANPDKLSEVKAKKRPLPENRSIVEDPEFGYLEPGKIPEGKVSVRQALEFITNHQRDPAHFNATQIATEYKVDKRNIQQILKHFKTLDVQIPMLKDGKIISPEDMEARPRIQPKQPPTMLKESSPSDSDKSEGTASSKPSS